MKSGNGISLVSVLVALGLLLNEGARAWEPAGALPYGAMDRAIEAQGMVWIAGGGTVFSFNRGDMPAAPLDTIFVYGSIRDLDYSNGLLYIATDQNGLFVYNIALRAYEQVGFWQPEDDDRITGCCVLSDDLLAVCVNTTIYLLNAGVDEVLGRLDVQPWLVNSFGAMERTGDLLAVESDYGGIPMLYLFDVNDPAEPQKIGEYEVAGNVHQILAVNDTLLYLSLNDRGIIRLNISPPDQIELLNQVGVMIPGGNARHMSFNGEHLFVSYSGSRDPTVGGIGIYTAGLDSVLWYRFTGGAMGTTLVWEDELWELKDIEGLYSIDISEIIRPRINWLKPMPHNVEGVFVRDGLAYLAEGHAGLRIVDYTDPTHPLDIGWVNNEGLAEDLWVDGDYACVADGNGFMIFDVSNPREPAAISRVTIETLDTRWVEGCAVENGIMYAAAHQKTVIVNVAAPQRPQILGEIQCSNAKDLAVRDSIVYIADNEYFSIYDCSNPREPVELSRPEVIGEAWDVDLRDTLALVSDRDAGLLIFDITDPEHPALLSQLDLGGCQGLDDDGHYTYVGLIWDGIAVVDIDDPYNPQIVATYDTPGGVLNVKSDGRVVVAGDYTCGTSYFLRPGLESVNDYPPQTPHAYGLIEAFPNPFNATLTVRILTAAPGLGTIVITDLLGRDVNVLHRGLLEQGNQAFMWNPTDLPSGNYLIRMDAGNTTQAIGVTLEK